MIHCHHQTSFVTEKSLPKGARMSDVQRICPHCGGSSAMQMAHCPHCGHDLQAGVPMRQENTLPTALGRAALPVLAGAASIALRAGWKLLQSRMAEATLQRAATQAVDRTTTSPTRRDESPAPRVKRTVRIRSSWAVGDARGNWRQGSSEHVIEFDD
jgi:hypothetical protein